MSYRYVSCQSFAGGFDVGAVQAGWQLVHKVEQKGGFGLKNCLVNRHILGESWTSQAVPYEEWEPVAAEAVFANPPCSGFSVMTDRRFRGPDAAVNSCMHALMSYAGKVRPEVVVMESVRSAFSQGHDLMLTLREKLEAGAGRRYDLYHVMQNALDLGGAAVRPRYFWVASTVPFGVEWPRLRRPVLADVIGDLAGLAVTWQPQPYRRPGTWWTDREDVRTAAGVVDGHYALTSPYIKRALDLLRAYGDWPQGWHIAKVAKALYERDGRLPPSWDHMIDRLLNQKPPNPQFHMGYTSMTRWVEARPARVITGGALGLVMHPTEPRTITHRETARVMGFPDDWRILPLRGTSGLMQTWGKGITTQCGRWIATQVRNALDGRPGRDVGTSIGDREWLIGMKPPKAKRALSEPEDEVCEPDELAVA